MSYSPHIKAAHELWGQKIEPGDLVIDATCGNGKDSLLLATLSQGNLIAIDIQSDAVERTKHYLSESLPKDIFSKVRFVNGSHATFPDEILQESVAALIYNLGYLPGGDKSLTTLTKSTLESIEKGTKLLKPGGFISITCYPGHAEGAVETAQVVSAIKSLDPKIWTHTHYEWPSRPKAPSLLFLQKLSDSAQL